LGFPALGVFDSRDIASGNERLLRHPWPFVRQRPSQGRHGLVPENGQRRRLQVRQELLIYFE